MQQIKVKRILSTSRNHKKFTVDIFESRKYVEAVDINAFRLCYMQCRTAVLSLPKARDHRVCPLYAADSSIIRRELMTQDGCVTRVERVTRASNAIMHFICGFFVLFPDFPPFLMLLLALRNATFDLAAVANHVTLRYFARRVFKRAWAEG